MNNSDINGNFQQEHHIQNEYSECGDIDNTKKEEFIPGKSETKTSQSQNVRDRKIYEVGVNHIHKPQPLIMHSIKDRSIGVVRSYIFDAASFAKWVRQDAKNQNELTQLKYIEERIEKDRDCEVELLKEKRDDITQPLNIDIQRLEAA